MTEVEFRFDSFQLYHVSRDVNSSPETEKPWFHAYIYIYANNIAKVQCIGKKRVIGTCFLEISESGGSPIAPFPLERWLYPYSSTQ